MPVRTPRLFTIPPSVPFLPALIEALLAGRLVDGFPALDSVSLALVPIALTIVVMAAAALPARRALKISPTVALRAE